MLEFRDRATWSENCISSWWLRRRNLNGVAGSVQNQGKGEYCVQA